MTSLEGLPVLAYLAAAAFMLLVARQPSDASPRNWMLPAGLAGLFLAFSLVTVWQDGLLQFWANHTTTLAGNQVWFDLLLAVSIAFYLMAPRARAVGMSLLPWALAVILTACVALLPMLARLIWLERRAPR